MSNEFDPDAYLAQKEKSFDPDAYLAQKANPKEGWSEVQSGLRGAAQGATLNTYPSIAAGVNAVTDLPHSLGELKDKFLKYQKEEYAKNEEAKKAHPNYYTGGEIGGSIATAAIPGMGALSIPKLAAMGAVQGYNAGAGSSLESPSALKDNLTNAGEGAALGAATQYGFNKIGQVAKALAPEALLNYANRRALTVVGANKAAQNSLSPAEQQAIGEQLRTSGIAKFGKSLDDVLHTANEVKSSSGKAIGDAIGKVDDLVEKVKSKIDMGAFDDPATQMQLFGGAGEEGTRAMSLSRDQMKKLVQDNHGFNMQRIGERIDQELIAPSMAGDVPNPLIKGELSKLAGISEDFKKAGSANLKFGQSVKQSQGRQTNFASDTIPQGYKQDLYGIVKEELENSIEKTPLLNTMAGEVSSDEAHDALRQYLTAKDNYRASNFAQETAEKGISGQNANRTLGLYDMLAGVGALASGHAPMAAPLAIGSKLMRKYGAGAQMDAAAGLAGLLEKTPEAVQKVSPAIGKAFSNGGGQVGITEYMNENNPLRKKPKSAWNSVPSMADGGMMVNPLPERTRTTSDSMKKAFGTPEPKKEEEPKPAGDDMLSSIYKYAKTKIPNSAHGMIFPGAEKFPGNDKRNDTLLMTAKVSPGEAGLVIPKSAVKDLDQLKNYVKNLKGASHAR